MSGGKTEHKKGSANFTEASTGKWEYLTKEGMLMDTK